ncbi:hypothetical protein [Nevskia ramosa]|uniref:hypothetical protein n=1 Tax=Nevskia ramosa TaxID=64002 RepID=UPI0012EB7E94|nr:hypothetical protein [Nevskia ramosa]
MNTKSPRRSAATSALTFVLALLLPSGLHPVSASELAEADALYDAGLASLAEAAQALEVRDATAAPGRLDVYIGQVWSSRWALKSLRWSIDQQAAVERTLDPSVSAAMGSLAGQGNRIRIERLPATAVARNLEVTVSLVDMTKPTIEPLLIARSLTIEPSPVDRALEIVVDGKVVGTPDIGILLRVAGGSARSSLFGMKLPELPLIGNTSSSSYAPGGADDPALGQVRSLRGDADAEAAERELLAIAARAGGERALPAAWWLERMRVAIALGRLDRAEQYGDYLSEHLAASDDSAADLAVERLALIEAHFALGEVDAAERLLPLARRKLPQSRQQDWQHLQGRVLLARQRSADAVVALDTGDLTDDAFRYMQSGQTVQATAYRRYNLAVAMLRNGDEARGLSWLDLLGRNVSTDPELKALRDKANLALGWHFLKARQGRTALGVLGRIPVDGLQADRALLGMGWAMLAPNGARQPRVDLALNRDGKSLRTNLPAPLQASLLRLRALEPELNGAMAPATIERDLAPKKPDDALRAAITVWQPLLTRDERSTAVLEGMLAIGYAQDQLRDAESARGAYRLAIDAMRRVEADLAMQRSQVAAGALRAAVESGSASSALYQTMDRLQLPFEDNSVALYALLGEYGRWQKLDVALRLAADQLASSSAGSDYVGAALQSDPPALVEPTLLEQIAAQREQLLKDAEAQALLLLDSRTEQLHQYLTAALFSLARLDDDPALAGRGSADCIRNCR